MAELAKLTSRPLGRVYPVIPVFNRVEETLGCIECLDQQSHSDIQIIVVDGGSTDGTPEIISERYSETIVLTSKQTLWWGGATKRGIDWALENGANNNDFILMVNNDTRFGPITIEYLMETSHKHEAVVGGVVISSDNPDDVIDGGVTLDWQNYRFSTVKEIPKGSRVKLDCDVLPGRTTLVPVWAIHKAGNIDDKSFPHYIADYEFTHRMKRVGDICLAVDYRAKVRTRVNKAEGEESPKSLYDAWHLLVNRRSKSNFFDHLHFIRKHAPDEERTKLSLRLIMARMPVPKVLRFVRRLWSLSWALVYKIIKVFARYKIIKVFAGSKVIRVFAKFFLGTYLVNEQDCQRFNLDFNQLHTKGVLIPACHTGYFLFGYGFRQLRMLAPDVLPLYWWAWSPYIKIRNYVSVHFK